MNRRETHAFLLAALMLSSLNVSVAAAPPLTRDEVIRVVSMARVLDPKYQLSVYVAADMVTITTYQNQSAKDVDRDCKIDAILVAKALYDKFGSSLPVVKLMFFNTRDRSKYKTVSVRPGDIRTFASGSLSQESLLSMLSVISGSYGAPQTNAVAADRPMNISEVREGIYKDKRIAILAQINEQRGENMDVSQAMQRFRACEDLIGRYPNPSGSQITQITTSLQDLTRVINTIGDQRNARDNAVRDRQIQAIPMAGLELPQRRAVYNGLYAAERANIDVSDLRKMYENDVETRIKNGTADPTAVKTVLQLILQELHRRNPESG